MSGRPQDSELRCVIDARVSRETQAERVLAQQDPRGPLEIQFVVQALHGVRRRTPAHSHDCDEVVLCLAGRGELHIDGRVQHFGAHQTLILPRNSQHQIFKIGAVPMETLGVFGATPVNTFLPDGEMLSLSWSS
ncbi:MAG: cupin domain-containing protein [Variovorax sp.]|nr:MAG: cupin domain-containing protein [Variovorax sp.]